MVNVSARPAVVKEISPAGFTLELSVEEASILASILGHFGGDEGVVTQVFAGIIDASNDNALGVNYMHGRVVSQVTGERLPVLSYKKL